MPLVIHTHKRAHTHTHTRARTHTHTHTHTTHTGLETSDADAGNPRRQVSTSQHVRFAATWLGGGRGRGGRGTRRLLWRERARGQWQHIPKVLYIVILYSTYTGALIFQNKFLEESSALHPALSSEQSIANNTLRCRQQRCVVFVLL
jgi:hypothetical protein